MAHVLYVTARLEEAGGTLIALPGSGHGTGMRVSSMQIVRELIEAYGYTASVVRPSPPAAAAITRMDEAFGWLTLIDLRHPLVRQIVGARCLVNPVSGKHLFPWRRLGERYGLDYHTVQRRHADGIHVIVARLIARGFIFPA